MNDILSVLLGVVIGVLASVPVALVIAVSTTPRPARGARDCDALDVVIESPSREVVVFDAECKQVTP